MASDVPLVLHVIHHLVIGGMENGLVNIVNHMPADAYRHAIVCIDDFSDFRARVARPDVEVLALHRDRIGMWQTARALFDVCQRMKPSIVHSRGLSGLDALLPARLAGVPYRVHSEHGWDVNDLDGRKRRPTLLRRLHAPLVDRYITVSKDLERYLIYRVGIGAGRITQIYNGVDTERFRPASPDSTREALPPALRGPGALIVGTVGRAQPVKDQETLLRAFAQAVHRGGEFAARLRVAIIGGGPLLSDLRELARSLGLGDRAWLPGPRDDVLDLLPAFDLFALPSLNEGISNTLLEAMACGVPVAATAVGGNVELVEDGVVGRLFAPGDAAALAAILADYAADYALRRRHGGAARAVALARFSLDAMVANYRAVYDRLCAGVQTAGAKWIWLG